MSPNECYLCLRSIHITKKNSKPDIQTAPVFTYLVSEIGESRDIYRFDIDQNDLDEATTLYGFFKGNKDGFDAINKDPRCKLFPIEKFSPEAHWAVDKWWSKEERVALKIEEEDKAIKFDDIPYVIEDIAENILEFKNLFSELSETKEVSALTFKEVPINTIFELPTIKGVTRSFIERNKGEVPVYGGKQFEEAIGFIKDELPNVKYFTNCLGWNRNGTAGYVFFHKDKFTTSDDHRPMLLKDEYIGKIDLEYARFTIENILLKKFSWTDKAGKDKVKKIEIPIPVFENGEFDIDAQKHLVRKYKIVNDLKIKAGEYVQQLAELRLSV